MSTPVLSDMDFGSLYKLLDLPAASTSGHAVEYSQLNTLVGASTLANLGTFTGGTIPDNTTLKDALQALETSLESLALGTTEVKAALTGVAVNALNLGTITPTAGALTATETIKSAIEKTEKAIVDNLTTIGVSRNATSLGGLTLAVGSLGVAETAKTAIGKLEKTVIDSNTLSGVARNEVNLGTFTGTTIADSSTIKTALQALETAVETPITNAKLATMPAYTIKMRADSSAGAPIDADISDITAATSMSSSDIFLMMVSTGAIRKITLTNAASEIMTAPSSTGIGAIVFATMSAGGAMPSSIVSNSPSGTSLTSSGTWTRRGSYHNGNGINNNDSFAVYQRTS